MVEWTGHTTTGWIRLLSELKETVDDPEQWRTADSNLSTADSTRRTVQIYLTPTCSTAHATPAPNPTSLTSHLSTESALDWAVACWNDSFRSSDCIFSLCVAV